MTFDFEIVHKKTKKKLKKNKNSNENKNVNENKIQLYKPNNTKPKSIKNIVFLQRTFTHH